MDPDRFDALARLLSPALSRRGVAGAVALAFAALAGPGRRKSAAQGCPSGTFRCGGNPTAECCPAFEKCCVSTGVCCGPNASCFRTPSGDVCRPDCPPNQFRCAGSGDGECCPGGQVCCGQNRLICCGPNEDCEFPGGGQPGVCRVRCPIGQSQCGGAGDCCTPVFQKCCGPRCCGAADECVVTNGEHRCAPFSPCLPGDRRCKKRDGQGACCPIAQACCNGRCCAPGQRCTSRRRRPKDGRRGPASRLSRFRCRG